TTTLDELLAQTALADARRAHDTHREAVPLECTSQAGVERGQLVAATDEPRETACGCRLEPGSCRACPDHLVGVDPFAQTLDGQRAKRFDGDKALRQSHRVGGDEN